jgi:RsfA family transcription factor
MKTAAVKSKKWTQEEEKILTNTVLQFLKDGRTQKEAFEEAAQSIVRTEGACSFRWNNKLKKNLQKPEKEPDDMSPVEGNLTLDDCIRFLKNYNVEEEAALENKRLKAEQAELQSRFQNADDVFHSLKSDYTQLLAAIQAVPELN